MQHLVETEGPLDYGLAADYIRQAAEGLAHAHAHNMVHGAVKPSNLLVNPQGVVKILDVGLSRLIEGDRGAGRRPTGRVSGSVDYLAPEQTREDAEVDARTDIYALGCTLYFLLTGHPPFPEGTLAERDPPAPNAAARRHPPPAARCAGRTGRHLRQDDGQAAGGSLPVGRRGQSCLAAVGAGQRVEGGRAAEGGGGGRGGRAGSDFAADPWWNTLSAAPARQDFAAEERPDAGGQGGGRGVRMPRRRRGWSAKAPARGRQGLARRKRARRTAPGWLGTPAAKDRRPGRPGVGRRRGHRRRGDDGSSRAVEAARRRAATTATAPAALRTKSPRQGLPRHPVPRQADDHGKEADGGRPAEPKGDHAGGQDVGAEGSRKARGQPPKTTGQACSVPSPPPTAVVKMPQPQPRAAEDRTRQTGGRGEEESLGRLASRSICRRLVRTASGAPVSFGAVHLAAGDALGLKLLSSDHGSTVIPKFALRQKAEAGRKENWLVAAAPPGSADDVAAGVDVARIWLEEGGLKFQWLKAAADARADYLRACGLLLAVGGDSRFLPLNVAHEETSAGRRSQQGDW